MANSPSKFPEAQRSNLVSQLGWLLQRTIEEEEVGFDEAFSRVALDILGYESGVHSDGRGDFGVDYWIVEERTATVFQFKSHDFTEAFNPDFTADTKILGDLPR